MDLTHSEIPITIQQALDFWLRTNGDSKQFFVVAADWRVDELPGEEGWFEEIGSDEFEDEDFLEQFAEARFELWSRH